MTDLELVLQYHERTKHYPQRFARSAGYLDWDTQPDPFRRFDGAPLIPLVLSGDASTASYDAIYQQGAVCCEPVCLNTISALFELSLALSAWKEFQGSRWALRINPSSGNLHPTEGYLVSGAIEGLHDRPGVYHYAPKEHALERRTEFAGVTWDQMVNGFPVGTFFVGLSSIHWREAWKYGERAYRYCQHDVGHALAAVAYSAAVQGWKVRLLTGVCDAEIARLLGLDRSDDFEDAEREHPDLLVAVVPGPVNPGSLPTGLSPETVSGIVSGDWSGRANRLSSDHVDWEIIDAVADASVKKLDSLEDEGIEPVVAGDPLAAPNRSCKAVEIIRARRSAVAMDGESRLPTETFYGMLDRLIPRPDRIPFSVLSAPAYVHLGLFVHLVDGIPPGLYALVRSADALAKMKSAMRSEFRWEKPPNCPATLPLFLLAAGDVRAVAWQVSCDQQIAGASAFSCGMIAEFEPRLRRFGSWFYRRLFWETGMIGQVLYLEAEAAGIRSTGIGCFFDEPVHEVFGLSGTDYQSLYHFTVGGAVDDTRLSTLPPYSPEVYDRAVAT